MTARLTPLLVAFCAALVACDAPPPPEPPPLRPVRFEVVEATGGAQMRDFPGLARAGVESRLSFRVNGTLDPLPVSVGDEVSEGDLIAQLDDSDYQLQVQQASANASQARAQARNAEANYDRVRQLYENQGASRSDLENARAARDSGSASSRAAWQQVEIAQTQVEYCTLRAPTDGVIAQIDVQANENIAAGQVVVVLASGTDVEPEVEVGVPESVIADINRGDTVSIRFDAIDGDTFEGVVTEVGVQPGPQTSTFPITIRLREAASAVRPGMAAQASFTLGDPEETAIWIPPHAVDHDDDPFVYVLETNAGDGVVRKRTVELGVIDARGFEVLAGLESGERLVTAGLPFLEDGMAVQAPVGLEAAAANDEAEAPEAEPAAEGTGDAP